MPNFIKNFLSNTKANLIAKVSDTAAALIVIAVLVPIAFSIYLAVNTSTWDSTLVTVWDMIPVISVVGLLLAILFYAISRRK